MDNKLVKSQINEIVSLYFDGCTVKKAIEMVKRLPRELLINKQDYSD